MSNLVCTRCFSNSRISGLVGKSGDPLMPTVNIIASQAPKRRPAKVSWGYPRQALNQHLVQKELDGRIWEEELTGDSRHIYEGRCWIIFLTAPTGIINPTIVTDVFGENWEHTNVFPFVVHSRKSPLQWRSFKKPQLTPIARRIDSQNLQTHSLQHCVSHRRPPTRSEPQRNGWKRR